MGMMKKQTALPLPDTGPSIAQARIARAAAEGAERTNRWRQAEERAGALLRNARDRVGVDALCAQFGLDRSYVYAQARGDRPAQLATLLACIRFDPDFGREAVGDLAAELDAVVVPRGVMARLLALVGAEDEEPEVRRLRRSVVAAAG